jgi:hypothetical protein
MMEIYLGIYLFHLFIFNTLISFSWTTRVAELHATEIPDLR